MTKVQFIKIAGGVELAILPKSEYDRLAKQTADEDVGTQFHFLEVSDAYPNLSSRFPSISVPAGPGTGDGTLRRLAARTALHLAVHPV